MPDRNTQIIRQWEIIWSLRGPAGRTIKSLAAEHGVCTRTIRRDLAALESAGYPLVEEVDYTSAHGRKRWRLLEGFSNVPPVPLTREEAYAVLAATQAMRGLGDTPIGEAFSAALGKLRKAIKPLDAQMTRLCGTYLDDPEIERRYSDHRETILRLLRAVHQRELLDITYYAAHNDQVTRRTVAPIAFWRSGGELYLIAHCYLRDAPRSFRVDRFREISCSAEEHPWPEDFDPADFLRYSFGPWVGEPRSVVLRFTGYEPDYFADLAVHPTQRVASVEGGALLTLEVAPSEHLARWLAGFGAQVSVEEPQELREWVREIHLGALGLGE
jgi:predicted DNA-binding transcriptional regulator YafY